MTDAATQHRVTVTMEGGVADVRLSRPDKLNALDPAMFAAIIAVGAELSAMQGLRAVVLSGEGRGFCAGLDVATMATVADPDAELARRNYGSANGYQQAAMLWRDLPVPVIAAVHGICFGGGLQIASGADIRIATPDARLAILEMKWGLIPDMGGFALWLGRVRQDVLRELIFTNREFDGREARDLGIVTSVADDPLAAAHVLARTIADRNPDGIRAAKRLANAMADTTLTDLLRAESREQAALLARPNQREAVMAQLQNRAPDFTD